MQFLTAGKNAGGDVQQLPSSAEPDAMAKKHLCAIIGLIIMEWECWSVSNMAAMFFNLSFQCEPPLEAR